MGIKRIFRLFKKQVATEILIDEDVKDGIKAEVALLGGIEACKSLITQKQVLTRNYHQYLGNDQSQDDIQAETDYYELRIGIMELKFSKQLLDIEEKQHQLLQSLYSLQDTYMEIRRSQRTNPLSFSFIDLYLRDEMIKTIIRKIRLIQHEAIIYEACPENFLNFDKFTQKIDAWEARHQEVYYMV